MWPDWWINWSVGEAVWNRTPLRKLCAVLHPGGAVLRHQCVQSTRANFPPVCCYCCCCLPFIQMCNKWAMGDSHMDAYLNKDWICMYIEYLLNPHFLNIFYIEQNMNEITFLYQTLEADDIWLRLIIFCSVADPDPFHSNGSRSGLKNQPKVIEK